MSESFPTPQGFSLAYEKQLDGSYAPIVIATVSAGTISLPAAPLAGQRKVAVTGTPVALGSGALSQGVVITAKPTNLGNIFVGPSGVNTTDDASGNGYRLEPGQSISYAVANLSSIFINGTANDSVYYTGS